MAITVRAALSGEVNGTTLTVTIPGAAQAGDVAVAVWSTGTNDGVLPAPAGWTALGTPTVTNSQSTQAFYKVLTSGDISAPVSFVRSTSGKHAVAVVIFAGVDTTDPIALVTPIGYTVSGADRLSPAGSYDDVAYEFAAGKGTSPGAWTDPAGFTNIVREVQDSSGAITVSISSSTTQLSGGNTWSLAAAWPQGTVGGFALTPDEDPPEPVAGTCDYLWPGAAHAGGFTVNAKVSATTALRLAVSSSPTMTSPSYLAVAAPDGYGLVSVDVSGLNSNSRYYFQLEDTPAGGAPTLIGDVGTLRTLGLSGTPVASRKVSIGGCLATLAPNTLALQAALAWGADWGHFNGDFFYNANTVETEVNWVNRYAAQIAGVDHLPDFVAAGLAAFELVSDHDTTNVDNGDSDNPWSPYEISAWGKVVPHLDLTDPEVRDQQWNDGRVSYFMIDVRSPQRSPGAAADNSSKTMLGAEQLARLLAWLDTNPAPFKVIVSDPPWMGAPDTVAKPDAWWSYATERQTIIDAIAAQSAHVEVWHGDSHLIGYATATKNAAYGGIPVICAAPWSQTGGGRNTSTFSEYFNNGSTQAQQYGRVTFTDDGETITRVFEGYDAISETVKFTFTTTVDAPFAPPTGPTLRLGTKTVTDIRLGTTPVTIT